MIRLFEFATVAHVPDITKTDTLNTFNQLGLSSPVLKALTHLGFEKPTDIQAQAIPHLLTGDRDFIGLANTGTGKTAAFGLPLLERIDTSANYTQALVLAPTRELGQQIAQQLEAFGKFLPKVNTLAVYGGAPISNQMRALRQPQHVIIATPGRLIDLIERKAVNLSQLQYLVLDEADEMLNMGFKEAIDRILSFAPKNKTTWLFSATMPNEIKRIVNRYMDNPVEIRVDNNNKVNVNIEHQYTVVSHANKMEALIRFFDSDPDMRGLVFCRTKHETKKLAQKLMDKNYKVDALHGNLSQPQRDRVMKRFRDKQVHVLIATDVAARGIDVNDLSHVFHHSLPDDHSYYTHRSGRTARAGKTGISIAFVNGGEVYKVQQIEKQLGIQFKKEIIPTGVDIASQKVETWCQDILNTKTNGKVDPQLLEKANLLFGNLSKEELIAKMLVNELGNLNQEQTTDINNTGLHEAAPKRGNKYQGKRASFSNGGGYKGRKPRTRKRTYNR